MWNKIVLSGESFLNWLLDINGAAILLCTAIVVLIRICYPIVKNYFKHKIKLIKCLKMYDSASKEARDNPGTCIDLCYHVTRELLELAGIPREGNMELFDYGATLKDFDKTVCKEALVIFFYYTQFQYSVQIPTEDDSIHTLERTNIVKDIIVENYL